MTWTHRERLDAVLAGERADRPPVTAWWHDVAAENDPHALAQSTVDAARRWDWDWVKLNPRATYYAETWGATFDTADYLDVLPRQIRPAVEGPDQLAAIAPRGVATPGLAEQVLAAGLVVQALPGTPVLQTVFSPLTVLLQLVGAPFYPGASIHGSSATWSLTDLVAERSAAHRALHAIALTLADYVSALLAAPADGGAGAAGVFYAVTGTAHPALADAATFAELSRPYDEIVLAAASGSLRVLHTCGPHADPARFADYPVDALHWDQHAAGNPGVGTRLGPATVGGVAHDLFGAHRADVITAQARAAIQATDGRLLLTPACSLPLTTDDSSLAALRAAAA